MIKKILLLLLLLLLNVITAMGQDLQEGFTFLETGKYAEAATFFETILQKYPDHKTARLCHGRAVGLSGNSKKAITIFSDLKKEYPNDFEIKLNYAASLLWDKQFEIAAPYYQKLMTEDTTSFPAILGYANTLSNLKKYQEALPEVNKALEIEDGNPNALLSRKYIRLGYANQLATNKEFEKALALLDKNLIDFPKDKDTQLQKANLYLITDDLDSSEKVYLEMTTNPKDSIVALNGLSLVAHKRYQEKKALELATAAVTKATIHKKDQVVYLSAKERYLQALLWNRKFPLALKTLETLQQEFSKEPRVQALLATYGMYTSNFKTSLTHYTAILTQQKHSFDGNLGIANAYRATGNDLKAFEYAFRTLDYYPRQTDAEALVKKLKTAHTPFITQKTAFTFDNGNNEALNVSLGAEVPLTHKFKTKAEYTYRNTKNTLTNNEASTNELAMRIIYKYNGNWSLETKGGISKSNAFTTTYTQWTADISVKAKPAKLQNLELGYQRELQNFNAALIDQEIVMNNYALNYNLSTNFNLGWYTQYMFTAQTDDNARNLLFTSLYYTVLQRPAVKLGANYQHITFKNQVPTIYFSPKKFHVVELFADMVSTQSGQWVYGANAAVGYQFIATDPKSITFRAEGKLGYQISNRFLATLYGKHSNIASATASGFQFTEFGFLLKWYMLAKPIFNKKIMELKKTAK